MHINLSNDSAHWTIEGGNPPIGIILCSATDTTLLNTRSKLLPNKVMPSEYQTALPAGFQIRWWLKLNQIDSMMKQPITKSVIPAAYAPLLVAYAPRAVGAGESGGGGEPGVDAALLAHRAGDFTGTTGRWLGREGRRAVGEGFGGGVPGDGRVFRAELEIHAGLRLRVGANRNCATCWKGRAMEKFLRELAVESWRVTRLRWR
jgi:hypothetical protein